MENSLENLCYFVAWAIVNDRQTVVKLLGNSAVLFSTNVSDEKLTEIVINNLYDNIKFRDLFYNYIVQISEISRYSNAPGDEGGGFWSSASFGDITSLVNTGLGFLATTKASKNQRDAANATAQSNLALAQAQAQANTTQLEIAKLQLAAAQLKPKNNTVLYLAIGVVALISIGVTIYAVTKK